MKIVIREENTSRGAIFWRKTGYSGEKVKERKEKKTREGGSTYIGEIKREKVMGEEAGNNAWPEARQTAQGRREHHQRGAPVDVHSPNEVMGDI